MPNGPKIVKPKTQLLSSNVDEETEPTAESMIHQLMIHTGRSPF